MKPVSSNNTAPIVSVKDLTVHFPLSSHSLKSGKTTLQAIENVSFSVFPGETVGLVGESGCGKSTIARVLLGLQKPTGGEIKLNGKLVNDSDLSSLRKELQLVFQDPQASLNPRMKIWTQVSEPLFGHRNVRSRAKRKEAAAHALERVGMKADDGERFPHEFSGGQRQRICIARALVIKPKLLVADEPTASLDIAAQEEISHLLKRLVREESLSLLLISHDLSGISELTERLIVLYLGKIMETGPTEEILKKAKHPYTKALIDASPGLDSSHSQKRVILSGDPPSPVNPPAGCVFHTRCPHVMGKCKSEVPVLAPDDGPVQSACFLNEKN